MTPEEYRSIESEYLAKSLTRSSFYQKLIASGLPDDEALKCVNYADGYYDDDVVVTLTTPAGEFRGLLLRLPQQNIPKTFLP
ncbi:MAG: hypothetical protein NTV54_02665 [Ignavibacteriales bacterium]|nr:hypothetical protein [Ignavibacteriales bacterium]